MESAYDPKIQSLKCEFPKHMRTEKLKNCVLVWTNSSINWAMFWEWQIARESQTA
jgi:hypothetical protein